jgi:hypothetical protein
LSAQQKDGEHGSPDDKAREFSSALEEELAKLPSDPVPEPPKYPLLQVISHDRSMVSIFIFRLFIKYFNVFT